MCMRQREIRWWSKKKKSEHTHTHTKGKGRKKRNVYRRRRRRWKVKGLVCYRRLIIQVERLLFNCCTERIEKERGRTRRCTCLYTAWIVLSTRHPSATKVFSKREIYGKINILKNIFFSPPQSLPNDLFCELNWFSWFPLLPKNKTK